MKLLKKLRNYRENFKKIIIKFVEVLKQNEAIRLREQIKNCI